MCRQKSQSAVKYTRIAVKWPEWTKVFLLGCKSGLDVAIKLLDLTFFNIFGFFINTTGKPNALNL